MKIGYLGIDVSKGYSDFVLLDKSRTELESCFQLDDNHVGHAELIGQLKVLKQKHGLTEYRALLESTGGYENNWFELLKKSDSLLNIKVARVNPLGVKHDSQARMERTITDSTSARSIAIYALNHPEKINWEGSPVSTMYSMRSMYNYIRTKTKQKVQLSNQLEKLLYSGFPELLSYMAEQTPNWIYLFLELYPTAFAAKNANAKDFESIPRITKVKARILYKKAKESIASADNQVLREIIRSYAKDINLLSKQIEHLKRSLEKHGDFPHEIQLLTSFPGIGIYSAIGLMIEIEDINRFENSKKMCSFFGLHPKFKQSGDKTSKVQMSKQGSPEIRAVLFMIAKSGLVYNSHIRALYDRFRGQGMLYKQAMGVIMHKILRIVYGMLKSGTEYTAAYDQAKQLQSALYRTVNEKVQLKSSNERKRRFITGDEDAPISKRQEKKRKEQSSSSPKLNKEINAGYNTDCSKKQI
jgi:transposase